MEFVQWVKNTSTWESSKRRGSFFFLRRESKGTKAIWAQRTRVNVSAVSACFSPVRGFHLSYLLLNSYYALQTALSFDSRNEIHRFSSYVRALRLLLRLWGPLILNHLDVCSSRPGSASTAKYLREVWKETPAFLSGFHSPLTRLRTGEEALLSTAASEICL